MSELWTECPNLGHTTLATIDCELPNILSPKGSRKKSYFLVDSPVRPFTPSLGLVVKRTITNYKKKKTLKNSFFYLNGQTLTPSPSKWTVH